MIVFEARSLRLNTCAAGNRFPHYHSPKVNRTPDTAPPSVRGEVHAKFTPQSEVCV
jgi:hypothetical protein